MKCQQELCEYWTGQGCICTIMDLPHDEGACPECARDLRVEQHQIGCPEWDAASPEAKP